MTAAEVARHIPGYDPWADAGPFTFDESRAAQALAFFREVLTFADGPRAGQPFLLEQWQQAIVANLYGWWDGDARRYREAFVYVPRKNGKTPLAAGLLLHEMSCLPVPGGQYYSAAADREQAALIFRDARRMIANEKELSRRFRITPSLKTIERMDGDNWQMYKALSSEAGTKHGLRPAMVIVDELHAHPNAELVETLLTGTALKGVQPLVVFITTADYQRESVCNRKYQYAKRVQSGALSDRSFLPVIYEASADDDWKSVETWRRANPNYGVSVSEEFLARECERAQHDVSYENTFKRLHLNVRTESVERIIPMESWDRCAGAVDAKALEGQPCYGGLDLSTEQDLTAFVLLFECGAVLPFFWLPEENAATRQKRDGVPYQTWLDGGLLEKTSGNFVSHHAVSARIKALADVYDIRAIAFDRAQAAGVYEELTAHGIKMLKMHQSAQHMDGPFKALLARLGNGELRHGGHPVLRWMATNVVAARDSWGRIRPSRAKSSEKIDGIAATLMAIAAEMELAGSRLSVYEERGVRFV